MIVLPPLSRQKVQEIIHGKSSERSPCFVRFWIPKEYIERCRPEIRTLLENFQDDVLVISPQLPGWGVSPLSQYPEYRWYAPNGVLNQGGWDNRPLIQDWSQLDVFLKHLPDPTIPVLLDKAKQMSKEDTRYRVGHFWHFYYERLWMLRGMENALTDFYLHPQQVHQLFQAITDIYLVYVDRLKRETQCNAIFVTDDLGTQNNLMFHPDVFREFIRPYYQKIIDRCHEQNMDFWLHSCGNVEPILQDLVDMGVDVLHPIQKYAMNQQSVSQQYKRDICLMAGMDLQQVLPYGNAQEIEKEVDRLFYQFADNGGRFIFALGNVLTEDVPQENMAYLLSYLLQKIQGESI